MQAGGVNFLEGQSRQMQQKFSYDRNYFVTSSCDHLLLWLIASSAYIAGSVCDQDTSHLLLQQTTFLPICIWAATDNIPQISTWSCYQLDLSDNLAEQNWIWEQYKFDLIRIGIMAALEQSKSNIHDQFWKSLVPLNILAKALEGCCKYDAKLMPFFPFIWFVQFTIP